MDAKFIEMYLDIVSGNPDQLIKGRPVLPGLVANRLSEEPSQRGKKIRVPIPVMPTTLQKNTGTDLDIDAGNQTTAFKEVELTESIRHPVQVTGEDLQFMYQSPDQFYLTKVAPIIDAIMRDVERDGIKQHINMSNVIGTAGTPPDGEDDYQPIILKADQQFMPRPRHLLLGPTAYSKLLSISEVKTALNYGSATPIQEGVVPTVWGMTPHKVEYLDDVLAGKHAVGGWRADDGANGIEIDQADHAAGDTTVHIDGLTVSQASGYIRKGDRFTVAGDTTIYTITANAATDSNGDADISYMPAAAIDWADGINITVLDSSNYYTGNILLNPAGLFFANAVPVVQAEGAFVRAIPIGGFGTILYEIFWDRRATSQVHVMHYIYGWAVGQQNMSLVILG